MWLLTSRMKQQEDRGKAAFSSKPGNWKNKTDCPHWLSPWKSIFKKQQQRIIRILGAFLGVEWSQECSGKSKALDLSQPPSGLALQLVSSVLTLSWFSSYLSDHPLYFHLLLLPPSLLLSPAGSTSDFCFPLPTRSLWEVSSEHFFFFNHPFMELTVTYMGWFPDSSAVLCSIHKTLK